MAAGGREIREIAMVWFPRARTADGMGHIISGSPVACQRRTALTAAGSLLCVSARRVIVCRPYHAVVMVGKRETPRRGHRGARDGRSRCTSLCLPIVGEQGRRAQDLTGPT